MKGARRLVEGFGVGWISEWAVAAGRPRLLFLDVVIPLVLIVPLVSAGAPAVHAAAAASVLFVLFGVFGSAIPLVRDGASGLLLRWSLAGADMRGFLAGRLVAQTVLDLLQLLPSLAVAAAVSRSGWLVAVASVGALGAALLFANALGAWAAALARSLAEAALFSAVAALLALHLGGVFRTPGPGTPGAVLEALSPVRWLHESTLTVLGAGPTPLARATGGISLAVLFWGLTVLAAHPLVGRLVRARS